MIWVGALVAGWAALAPLRAAAQPQPVPPAGPVAPGAPKPGVTAFQRPPGDKPEDLYREPPFSPFLPRLPANPDALIPEGARVNLPAASRQVIRFGPRYGKLPDLQIDPLDKAKNINRLVYTGGVIVNVVFVAGDRPQEVEFATDNAVAWITGAKAQPLGVELNAGGEGDEKTEVELYMTGNVIIRTLTVDSAGKRTVAQTFRAKEMFYDVNNNRAIARDADLELNVSGYADSFHMTGKEIWQLGPNEWKAFKTVASASKRPNDPGLTYESRESTLVQQETTRTNIFGVPYRNLLTGDPDFGYERILTNRSVKVKMFDVPFFYLPRQKTDISEPLGPLKGIGFRNDGMFGTQLYTTTDLYKLFALKGPPGHQWTLFADYLSDRGPGFGSAYEYIGTDLFGYGETRPDRALPYSGLLKAYYINDKGEDVLGGDRGPEPIKPENRWRFQAQHIQDLYENGTSYLRSMTNIEYITDKNFLEQYYKFNFDTKPNHETFTYLYGASGNVWGSTLLQGNLDRRWVTETEWWPRFDGALIGESFLDDRLIYTARGSAGYAGLRPALDPPPPVLATDQRIDTGRFDAYQKLSAPFDLGPLRFDPYGVMDLAYYTQDLTGESRGRFYGGGGLAASMYLSKLYPDASSELLNAKGIYHKINLGANYFAAHSDTPYNQLPQLDRLSDDSTDFTYRLTRPRQKDIISGPAGVALSNSPIFDPQLYAIRRLVDNRPDTLDSMQVIQLDARQRLQTKRGFPGNEHVVDLVTLDLSMSVFPDAKRDNFGEKTAFFEYFFQWNFGDRTSFTSAGWYDPFENGAQFFNLGLNFSRPDGTTFFLGYRHTDPINSRAVTASAYYKMSAKYSLNLTTTYDFGDNQALNNQVSVTRIGADVTVLFGFSYNALVNNFGVQFAILPNLLGLSGVSTSGNSILGAR